MSPSRSLFASLLVVGLAPAGANLYQKWWVNRGAPAAQISVPQLLGGEAGAGFERPEAPRTLAFPRDHSEHAGFRTEWWYFTGNLSAAPGRDFGYELTLFRQALQSPVEALQPRTSSWAARHAYMGHFAMTDLAEKKFVHFQKLSRAALGLAGCEPGRVWVEDWEVTWPTARSFHVKAARQAYSIDLSLESLKSPVLQGDKGLSRKGAAAGQASFYYSMTRLKTAGQLGTPEGKAAVSGLSWMDREWSTRPLSSDLSGWDWFALQLDDGSELMVYQLRDTQGRPTAFSAGTWIPAEGEPRHLSASDIKLTPTGSWASALDATTYPSGWRVDVPGYQLRVEPRLADQELSGLARYWEGSVRVTGSGPEGARVDGLGYVELVGYADSENTRAK